MGSNGASQTNRGQTLRVLAGDEMPSPPGKVFLTLAKTSCFPNKSGGASLTLTGSCHLHFSVLEEGTCSLPCPAPSLPGTRWTIRLRSGLLAASESPVVSCPWPSLIRLFHF